MSSYDPYRFLQGQQPPPRSSIEQIHIPAYASPDLDPSKPLPGSRESHSDIYVRGQEQKMSDQEYENEPGPSRKRVRDSEGTNGSHSNGHGYPTAQAQGQVPVPVDRPVPLSMFGFDARNDLTREIGNWLVNTCQGRENIEIEIKLGRIILPRRPNDPPTRIQIAAGSERTVYGDIPHAFLSDMTHKQHHNLNIVLNQLVESPPDPGDKIRYKRIKQRDSFYRQQGRKIRVSALENTGEITEIIQKEKVDHLDIYCPAAQLDLRISVNTETPCMDESVPEGEPEDARVKDRISYSNSVCQTDLTWVSIPVPDGKPKSTFEVEVEVKDAITLIEDSQSRPELFDKKLMCCLDTARILMRNA